MSDTATNLKLGVKVDPSALSDLITATQKACNEIKETWETSNHKLEEDYQNYINAKKILDNKSAVDYEEYEKAKTLVEQTENDERLKSYIDYKDKEEAKNKQVIENTKKLANTLTLTLTTPLVGLAGLGLKAASKIEDYTASFKTLLGTEPAAKKMIKTINEMAAATPFDPDPLIQSTEKLLAFGIEAENVNDVLNMLGDSSKGSAEALQTLSTAYGKVAAKGKASMEELNMMIDRGVPILGELANIMGVSEDKIIKMVSEGKVGFNELNQAFKNMTSEGGVFYKGMETASQTLSGKFSTLKGNMSMLGAAVMEEVLPTVKSLVDFANKAVKSWSNMGSGMKSVILSVGSGLAVFGPALGTITKMTTTFGKLIPLLKTTTVAINGARTAQLGLNAAMAANPTMLLVAGLAAAGTALAVFIAKQKAAAEEGIDYAAATQKQKTAIEEYVSAIKETHNAVTELDKSVASDNATNLWAELKKATTETSGSVRVYAKLLEDIKNKEEDISNAAKMNTQAERDYWTEYHKEKLDRLKVQKKRLEDTASPLNGELVTLRDLAMSLQDIGVETEEIKKKLSDLYLDDSAVNLVLQKVEELRKKKAEIAAAEEEARKKEEQSKLKIDNRTEYEKDLEAHNEYVKIKEQRDYKASLIEQKLIEGNTAVLDAELAKREAREKKYQAVIAEQKAKAAQEEADIRANSAQNLEEYLNIQSELIRGQYDGYEGYYQKDAAAQDLFNKTKLQDYIDYLKDRKENGLSLEKEEESLLFRWVQINKQSIEETKIIAAEASKDISASLSVFSTAVSAVTSSIQTNFDALPGTLTKVNAAIASSVGKSGVAAFNALSNSVSAVVGHLQNWDKNTETLKDTGWSEKQADGVQKVQVGLEVAASTLSAIGEATSAVFDAVLENIQDTIDKIDDDLNKTLDGIKAKYDAQREELQKSNDENFGTQYQMGILEKEKKERLEMLKSEWAERGIILETGYETELEKAQEAYQNSIEAYQEALDEYTGLETENEEFRNEQLELYKQALEGKTDKELEEALKNKEIELQKTALAAQEEKKRTATEKLQEAERNRNQLAAEVEKQKIIDEANKKEEEAKVKAENERLRIEHESELESVKAQNAADKSRHEAEEQAFYATMASQIAQVWINAAAGTAAAWASCMPLGPIAGPIAASILTTALMSVAGVQTGTIASQSPPANPTPRALPKEPAYIPVPSYATGVTAFQGGMALVGEEGPELVTLPQGANVITNENTNDILATLAEALEGGTSGDITVNVTCVIDGSTIPIKEQLIEIQRDEMFRSRR
jgi:tape measure domain-containing protein